ncbi:hypothetical protein D9M69_698250 [compost metagenome]
MIALLEELEGDEDLLAQLAQDFFRREPPGQFDTQYWVEVRYTGRNIFRMKYWDANHFLLPYRVIYAHKQEADEYYILGIVPREWDYDVEHKLSKRMFKAYDEL